MLSIRHAPDEQTLMRFRRMNDTGTAKMSYRRQYSCCHQAVQHGNYKRKKRNRNQLIQSDRWDEPNHVQSVVLTRNASMRLINSCICDQTVFSCFERLSLDCGVHGNTNNYGQYTARVILSVMDLRRLQLSESKHFQNLQQTEFYVEQNSKTNFLWLC